MFKDKISRALEDHFVTNKVGLDDQRQKYIEFNNRVRGELFDQEPSHIKAKVAKQHAEDCLELEKSRAETRIPDGGRPVSYGSHAK